MIGRHRGGISHGNQTQSDSHISSSKVRSALRRRHHRFPLPPESVSVPQRFDQRFGQNEHTPTSQERRFQFLKGSISTSAFKSLSEKFVSHLFQFLKGSISTSAYESCNRNSKGDEFQFLKGSISTSAKNRTLKETQPFKSFSSSKVRSALRLARHCCTSKRIHFVSVPQRFDQHFGFMTGTF